MTNGHDAPVNNRTDDLLGRWAFAKEVFEILSTSPPEWSVRVGLYGDWGSGKTSVMQFIETMARKSANPVVWFNPWRVGPQANLFSAFFDTLVQQAKSEGVDVSTKTKWKTWLPKIKKLTTQIASTANDTAGKVANTIGMYAQQQFRLSDDDFAEIVEKLVSSRVIVFIDDVDRADPRIVPQLLMAVRELLDLPTFSFVLAFDPRRLSEMLEEYHKGWKGTAFLEKIIDFPRWLPKPLSNQLLSLALADREEHCPFIDASSFDAITDLLPQNPRHVRQFIRQLRSLRREIERHDPDELDCSLLLLVNLFRARFPTVAYHVLMRSSLSLYKFSTARDAQQRKAEQEKHLDGRLDEALYLSNTTLLTNERQEALRLLRAIKSRLSFFSPDKVQYHAGLTEQPHAITHKEFRSCVASCSENCPASEISAWVSNHDENFGFGRTVILAELFETAVHHWDKVLGQAADGPDKQNIDERANDALKLLRFLETIGMSLQGFVGDETPPFLTAKHFLSLYRVASRWAHFVDPMYTEVRNTEKSLIRRIAERMKLPLFEVLVEVDPWRPKESPKEREQMREMVLGIINARWPEAVISQLKVSGGFSQICRTLPEAVERYAFGEDSVLWKTPHREQWTNLFKSAANDAVVHRNIVELMRSHGPGIKDLALASEMWKAACLRPLNPRMISAMREIRESFASRATEDVNQHSDQADELFPIPTSWT